MPDYTIIRIPGIRGPAGGTGGVDSGVTVSKTLFVDTAGSNASAMRGRLDLPFLTIAAARAAASAGDLIKLGPGTFTTAAPIVLPTDVSLEGSGIEATFITSTVTLSTGPIVIPGTRSRISHLTIQATAGDGTFQAPLGSNTGNTVFTNAVVSNVRLIGDSDGIFLQPDSACSLKVLDSVIETNWDAVVVQSASTVEMYGCEVSVTGPALIGLPEAGKGLSASASGAVIRFFSGKITANGSLGSNTAASASNSGVIEIHNTTTDVSGTVPKDLKQASSGVMSIDNVTRSDGTALLTTGTITQLSRFASRDLNGSDFSSASTFRTNIGAAASGANTDITSFAVTAASTMSLASLAPNGTITLWTLTNPTVAADGAQQYSPAQIQSGQGWKSDATAASRAVAFRNYVVPVQGTSNPSGYWTLESRIHTGAYGSGLKYFSDGTLQPAGGYLSVDGTAGASAVTGGATFKNGLYTSGTITGGGGGVSDGDYDDIIISSSATVFTIAAAAVTLAKMADLAQDQFIGRTTASTGVPQTATITSAARTVLDDTTVGAMVDTLGGASASGTGGIARATSPSLVTPSMTTPIVSTATASTFAQFDGSKQLVSAVAGTDYIAVTGTPAAGHTVKASSSSAAAWKGLVIKTTATNYTVGTTDPLELYGGIIRVTGACTITVPAVSTAPGLHFTVITIGAVAVSIDVNAADLIVRDGTAQADGEKITNTSTAGDTAVISYIDATGVDALTNAWTNGG